MSTQTNQKTIEFSTVAEYQRLYFEELYNVTNFANGYCTTSEDTEYFNANTIIGIEDTEDTITSICMLLASGVETAKIQLPSGCLDLVDENNQIALIRYENLQKKLLDDIEIVLVDESNYEQYLSTSTELQVQEYGKEYKAFTNSQYLNQSKYQMYLIMKQGNYVGEFTFIPKLNAVESIIILKEYQQQGIMRNCLELITAQLSSPIFMSADKSSIGFYQKIECQIIDEMDVDYLYGNSRNLLMYLSLSI